MNYDKLIDRHGTNCEKYDGLKSIYGRTDLLPMWIADMDFEVCPAITEAIRKRTEHPIYGYHHAPDSYWQSIMDWAKRRHEFEFTREEFCYMPGIVRAIAFAINYFTREGDKILIQQPVYHPFKIVIEGNHRIVVKNPLICTSTTMEMDLALLERQIREEKPRMMILCNPHNPGGIVWSKETLAQVAHICAENNVIVLSDEIHCDLEMFGNHYTPFATASEEAARISIIMSAPSKTFNIPGLISSWCVIKNENLRKGFFEWLTANEFAEPTLFLTVATEAAYTKGEQWLNDTLRYVEDNVRFVEQFLAERIPEIVPMRPQASFLIWLDCRGTGLVGKDLIDLFVDKAHLALNDGEMFGDGGEGHMRLNIGCPRETIRKALEQLEEAIKKYVRK